MFSSFSDRWPQFKKQFWPIIYVSLTQPVFTFQWPFYMQLASPWNYIAASIAAMVGILGMSLLLLFPEFSARIMVSQYKEYKGPFLSPLKPFSLNWAVFMTVVYVLMWRFDFYGLSNYWYFSMYLHTVALFFLLHRSIMQYIEETKNKPHRNQ